VVDQNHEETLLEAVVGPTLAGARLDQALASLFADYSRSRLQTWVREGRVSVNGEQRRPRDKVDLHDRLRLRAVVEDQVPCAPQDIPLAVVFEDEHLLVVNKPAGLVVHPAAGNPDGTLQNALLYRDPALSELPRAGIVHRLDKDTTGLMVIGRSQAAYKRLVEAIAAHRVQREYRALVVGSMPAGGTIDLPIGRHPTQRTRMAVNPLGKPAVTHFRVLERFRGHTLKVMLETSVASPPIVEPCFKDVPLTAESFDPDANVESFANVMVSLSTAFVLRVISMPPVSLPVNRLELSPNFEPVVRLKTCPPVVAPDARVISA